MPTTLPPRPPQNIQLPEEETRRFRKLQLSILWITALVLLALLAMVFLGQKGGRKQPLRVAILKPNLAPGGPLSERQREMISEAMLDTADRILAARVGVRADLIDREFTSAAHAADVGRENNAEEVLLMSVECPDGRRCRGSIRRLRAVDGSLQWRRSFRLDTEPLHEIDAKLGNELHVAFLKFERRPGGARLFCRPEDLDRFLRTRADAKRSRLTPTQSARAFAAIRTSAPRFYGAYLREAEQRLRLRSPKNRKIAISLLEEAHRIAPGDWRAPMLLVPLLLSAGEETRADAVLAQLHQLVPGDAQLKQWEQDSQ